MRCPISGLNDNDAWPSAMNHLRPIFRAANVDLAKTYLSDDRYFWMILSKDSLNDLLDRALAVCLP